MKTLFKKMSTGALLAVLFLNVNVDVKGQAWNIPGVGAVSSGSTTGYIGTTGSTDNMVIKTNSAERMRITSGGLVGIGTTAPLSSFQVGDSYHKVSIASDGWGPYIGFNAAYSSGNWQIAGDGDNSGGAAIMIEEDGSMIFSSKYIGSASSEAISNTNFGIT